MEKGIGEFLLTIIKATLFAVFVSLVSILLFALVIKLTAFSHVGVKVVNQFIKVASVFLGCFLFVREEKGLIKGLIIGVLYALVIDLVFGLISGNGVNVNILDILFMAIIGAISGVISVNVKGKK